MTGLKKCDAFFLIGGGAAVVITPVGLNRVGALDRLFEPSFERISARSFEMRAESSTCSPAGLRGAF
jgi:hypothetical protein